MMRMAAFGLVVALLLPGAPIRPAAAEGSLRIVEQFGVGYLPLHVLRDQGLVEKHGRAAGVKIEVEWAKLSGGSAVNDALLSGSVDVAAGGVAPLLTLWDRTRGSLDVKAISALVSMPYYLLTNRPEIRSIADFGPGDRIALPTPWSRSRRAPCRWRRPGSGVPMPSTGSTGSPSPCRTPTRRQH